MWQIYTTCLGPNTDGRTWNYLHFHQSTGKPDPPFDLRVLNATYNAITLGWKAGFDGGSVQEFQVRYLEVGETEGFKYADVVPPAATVFTVTGLKPSTQYELAVHSINRLGDSGYQGSPLAAKTSGRSTRRAQNRGNCIAFALVWTSKTVQWSLSLWPFSTEATLS